MEASGLPSSSQRRMEELEELSPYRRLSSTQQQLIQRLDSILDQTRDSVVISDPLSANSPIVYVTSCWEDMCGYSLSEAVGKNPRITQGERTSADTITDISTAVRLRRACKVRVVNYRGSQRTPFWNCLTVRPTT